MDLIADRTGPADLRASACTGVAQERPPSERILHTQLKDARVGRCGRDLTEVRSVQRGHGQRWVDVIEQVERFEAQLDLTLRPDPHGAR